MRAYIFMYVLVTTFLNYCIPFQKHTARLFRLMTENVLRNIPSSSRSSSSRSSRNLYSNTNFNVETKKGDDVLYSDLKASVRGVIKDWNYEDDAVHVSTLQGGITNRLYTLTPSEEEGKTIIVRVYGEGTALFVDRAVENVVFSTLSERGIGPKFYGTFRNGRVEGFCDAKTLKPNEMSNRDMYPKTATAIAQLHAQLIAEINQCAMLWVKLESFFDLAEQAIRSSEKKTNGEDDINLDDMRKESKWLRETLEALQRSVAEPAEFSMSRREKMRREGAKFGFEIVLCHNDLLAGNILLSNEIIASSSSSPLNRVPVQYSVEEKTGGSWSSDEECDKDKNEVDSKCNHGEEHDGTAGITLIDFEYAANNYRAWDIANHFNEFAGFDFDIKKDFPTKERRVEFLRHYVKGVYKQGSETCKTHLKDVVEHEEDMYYFIEGFEVSYTTNNALLHNKSLKHLLLLLPPTLPPSVRPSLPPPSFSPSSSNLFLSLSLYVSIFSLASSLYYPDTYLLPLSPLSLPAACTM